jgi:hypothetical protein
VKTKHSIIGSVIMGIIALGLFISPSPSVNDSVNQSIPVMYGDEKSIIDVKVPIVAMSADDVGTMHIELTYDPSILRAVGVTDGTITEDATIECNLEIPGRVIIGMVDSEGINGQGSLASIAFQVVGTIEMISPLRIENFKAWDTLNISQIRPTILDGSYRIADQSTEPPVVVFPQ